MATPFASPDWAESLGTALQGSARVRTESMSWIYGPVLLVIDADEEHGVPETVLRLDLHEGTLRSITSVPLAELRRSPFSIGGSFARWKVVFGGSLPVIDAVLQSRLRFRGDLPALVQHRSLFEAIAAAGSELDTAWQDDTQAATASA